MTGHKPPSLGVGAYVAGGVIENCLVSGNTSGIGALYLDGGNAVNCTVSAPSSNMYVSIFLIFKMLLRRKACANRRAAKGPHCRLSARRAGTSV